MQKNILKWLAAAAATTAVLQIGAAQAHELPLPFLPPPFAKLDHVFLIMMENQTSSDIIGNPNAPFINAYAKIANHATNYFGVGHPSLPNYLELTGGSNFDVADDFFPNWANGGCIDNAPSSGCANAVSPISAPGMDNAVPATALPGSNQCNGQIEAVPNPTVPATNNCALRNYPATSFTPKTIVHQLVAAHQSWKTYQEDLPAVQPGVNGVNYSDGELSNLSPPAVFAPGPIQKLYAVKHDPFVYFLDVQQGKNPNLSLAQVVDFDGPHGLWADLASGDIPNLAFIVPNQCHDQHGFVSGGTPICASGTDQANTPAEAAVGELLLAQGDAEVNKLVTGIKATRAWHEGRNAIVLVWDENDFANSPNNVVMLVETSYSKNGNVDPTPYDHFSLLRTLETGFGLPCLNHACDSTSLIMTPMFGFGGKPGNGYDN